MGSFFSLYIVYIIIRVANKYLDKDAYKYVENPYEEEKKIENYFPLVFHVIIAVLILFSWYSSELLDGQRIHALVSDGIFQLMSTALILLVSMINPFVPFSLETRTKLETWEVKDNSFANWLLRGKNWQFIKLLICILLVAYFIYNGYLVFPKLNEGLLSNLALVLIFLFVFGNVIQLIRNPKTFKQKTLFRLSLLYRSTKRSLIISAAVIALLYLFFLVAKRNFDDMVNIEGIALLIYNITMAYNEYNVLNAESMSISIDFSKKSS